MPETTTLKRFACSASEFVRYSRKPEHHAPEFAYLVRTFREHSAVILQDDIRQAAIAFQGLTGMLPDHINGVPVLGYCEACGKVFLEGGDPWGPAEWDVDSEGVYTCEGECLE